MDKREKRAVNDMGTAMKRIVEVLMRRPQGKVGHSPFTNQSRAEALTYAVGKALLAVKRIQRREEEDHG